jgi:integrase
VTRRYQSGHGFHAFGRGLATNLHDLGVDGPTIQRILRHGDVSTTRRCYIKTLPEQSVAANEEVGDADRPGQLNLQPWLTK